MKHPSAFVYAHSLEDKMKNIIKRRKIIFLCLAILLFGVCLFAFFDFIFEDHLSKTQIFNLVNKHNETLMSDISKTDYTQSLKISGIQKIRTENSAIYFDCGGAGFGSATSYYGFYYTVDDTPYGRDLLSEGKGWIWRDDGDDSYYTEKIREHFYYYEEHY